MNYRKLIVESGVRMINGGYTIGTWGNISIRNPETDEVYLSPSGMNYTTITEDDIIIVNLKGEILEGTRKPTIETALHVALYNARPELNAVVHTHPIYSTAFSCCGEDIPLILDEAAQILGDTCKTAEYALPGSTELAVNCVKALGKKANSCLLKSHGAVCVGENIESAFAVCKVLEVTAEIYQMICAMGKKYEPISPENIEAMQYFVKNVYGQR